MHNKKYSKGSLSVAILLILVCIGIASANNVSAKKVTVKKLQLEKGTGYKIKCKTKKAEYFCNKKNIAKVSKEGIVKGLKKGKCVVFVKKNNKVLAKYKVKVVNKKNNNQSVCRTSPYITMEPSAVPVQTAAPTPVPTVSPSPRPTYAPNFYPMIIQGVIISAEETDDGHYIYLLEFSEKYSLTKMREFFKDCSNVSRIQINSFRKIKENINESVEIVLDQSNLPYKVIDDSTVEVYNFYR